MCLKGMERMGIIVQKQTFPVMKAEPEGSLPRRSVRKVRRTSSGISGSPGAFPLRSKAAPEYFAMSPTASVRSMKSSS